jgi:hypothetical protein
MARVILYGEIEARYEAERLLRERHPELHVETFARSWEAAERAVEGEFDVLVVLRGPIAEHERRLELVSSLRRQGFAGRIIYAGAFLTEKHDAAAAGADYVFDAERLPLEQVVAGALYRPVVAADHPYLRYLFVGEWASVTELAEPLPASPPDLLVVAASVHPEDDFYSALADYTGQHPGMRCILVEDDCPEDVAVEAMASGVKPYVVLADEGLPRVLALGREHLREAWLQHVSRPSAAD